MDSSSADEKKAHMGSRPSVDGSSAEIFCMEPDSTDKLQQYPEFQKEKDAEKTSD